MADSKDIRELLELRRQELNQKVGEIDDTLRQPDSADWEERATENEDDEVLEDMGNAALVEIEQINTAIQRIDIGTYGMCTACGDPISKERLEALPYTANCLDCAKESEK